MALKSLIYLPLKNSHKYLDKAYKIVDDGPLYTLEVLERAREMMQIAWMGYKGVSVYLKDEDVLMQDIYGDSLLGIIRYRLSKGKKKTLADIVDSDDLKHIFNLAQAESVEAYEPLSLLLKAFSNDEGYLVVSSDDSSLRLEIDTKDRNDIGIDTSLKAIIEQSLRDVEGILNNIDLRMELVKRIDKEFELPDYSSKKEIEDNLEEIIGYFVARLLVFHISINEFLLNEEKLGELHSEVDRYTRDVISLMKEESVISWNEYEWGKDYVLHISSSKTMNFILKYTVSVVFGLKDSSFTDGEDSESLRVVKQDLSIEKIADDFFSL